jgi:ligand-binding sensor domain-containing protein
MKLKSIIAKVFKGTAIIKYLFFPFLSANAAGVSVAQVIGTEQTITAQIETATTLWVGTQQGLWKINKANSKVEYLTAENSQLPSNNITGLCIGANNRVYAATDKGVLRYDGYAYQNITTDNSNLPTDNITAIAADTDGNLWIGTDKGLVIMQGFKMHTFTTQNSVLSYNAVANISQSNGLLYVKLTNNNVIEIGNGTMHTVPSIIYKQQDIAIL